MNEATAVRRGVSFPVVPLLDAARILTQAGRYGAEHTEPAFATYLGHSTPNSGPFRTKLAAFRDWHLIARKGGRVVMTELGRRLALSADPSQEVEALREAFNSCGIFARLYEESAKGVPLQYDSLARSAVFNLGIAPKSQQRFIDVFVASAEAAKLAQRAGERAVRLLAPDEFVLPVPSDTAVPVEASPSEASRDAELPPDAVQSMPLLHRDVHAPSLPRSDAPVVLRQIWPHSSGSVVFEVRSRSPLPPAAFAAIAAVVEAASALVGNLDGGHDAQPR